MRVTEEMIEHCAKAIARDVPCIDGSRWNHGHGCDFPSQYDAVEQRRIRSIARTCIDAALEHARSPQDTAHD